MRKPGWWLVVIVILVVCCAVGAAEESDSSAGIVEKLMEGVPGDFPRFEFAGHEEQAKLLSHYLWYHFHNRGGNGLTLFNKEYLLTSDIWLGNARPRGSDRRIQDVDRDLLLGMQMDGEGYVMTHQHFSHAHDHGWPFPMWTQSDNRPDRVKGKTAGWHFQPLEKVPGWVGDGLRVWKATEYCGEKAASLWELHNIKSLGIESNRWQLEAAGDSPAITTPAGYEINAFDAPYLQLRWKRSGVADSEATPYVEWLGEKDEEFGPERRVYFYPEKTPLSGEFQHSIMTMHRHPKWVGKIERIRISLAPGRSDGKFEIDSFFTAYDTRHTINNPIFILASQRYFNWTGDLDFLRKNIDRMRLALRYQQTAMGGLKYNHIRNTWPGHGGLAGFSKDPNGVVTIHSGHGIGSNYWDLMPFGWDDLYATNQYYAATLAMADIEEAIERNPAWGMPLGALKMKPEKLRAHAQRVKETANKLFWNSEAGRFIASIDKNGVWHDYGYTFLNLDAIWYGLSNDAHAKQIMDWISGERVVEGDTSRGADIYHWRFGPRATTLRNITWYCQGWYGADTVAWGGQVQDGGAVLGFSFYDLWARLNVIGPDDCWQRLQEILAWEKEVHSAGGYRKYYEGGKYGTTLQGCGTPGGLGVDCEFYESSLVPSIVIYGLLGLDASSGDGLAIRPHLPKACPKMGVSNIFYHNVRMDLQVEEGTVTLNMKDTPVSPVRILLDGKWNLDEGTQTASEFLLDTPGVHVLKRQ